MSDPNKPRSKLSKEEATAAVASCLGENFRQQQMPAWRPLYSPCPVLTALWLIGAVFCVLAIVSTIVTTNVREISVSYGEKCRKSNPCTIEVDIPEPLRLPVAVYYELREFYQSFRTYSTSRSQEQLEGVVIEDTRLLSECSPLLKRNNSGNSSEIYFPCGLVAWSHFNDTFSLGVIPSNTSSERVEYPLQLIKRDIAPKYHRERYKFDPGENITGVRVVDNITDQDFLVWMRHASFPRFRKLYRRIESGIEEGATEIPVGKLVVHVDENVFPVDDFGSKHLVLTELSWLGGRNVLLGYLLFAVGGFYLVLAAVFSWIEVVHPRKKGDISMIPWVRSAQIEREYAKQEAEMLLLEKEGKGDGKDQDGAYVAGMFDVVDVSQKKGSIVRFE